MKNPADQKQSRNPWLWVPSLYFAEGIPYVVVMMVSVIMYKRLGVSNADIALYTSWLYLPWVIKPLWSPLVDLLKTKRFWVLTMQLLIGAGLAGIGLTVPLPTFFKFTLIFFWLLAFSSATHDIAADGFYMLGLTERQQAWFVGVRSTFYRFAMITGQGLLIIFAGFIESHSGLPSLDVTVLANPDTQINKTLNLNTFVSPDSGSLHIVCEPETLEIIATPKNKSEIDSIIAFAKNWNISQGQFLGNDRNKNANIQKAEFSWWHRSVVIPLETFLKEHFGEKKEIEIRDIAGNVGIFSFHLSRKPEPGKEIVITFGRQSGDKNITLIMGNRMVFTEKNWNKPALAVIQLDPKLNQPAQATFRARAGNIPLAWSITFLTIGALFIIFFVYHKFILPYPDQDFSTLSEKSKTFFADFIHVFVEFFKKERIIVSIVFILIYRFGEAQLVKIAPLFLLDVQEVGGLALTTGQYGFVYGTLGMIMLTLGGILGGFVVAKQGLKFWILWMALAMKLPDAVYVYLANTQPDNFYIISACVGIEQFGYGFGFTSYMLFMILVA